MILSKFDRWIATDPYDDGDCLGCEPSDIATEDDGTVKYFDPIIIKGCPEHDIERN
jgi:hypothetical protein